MSDLINIGLNSSNDPYPEYHLIRDMLETLYEKCNEFDVRLEEAEENTGEDTRNSSVCVNSAGIDTISIYDATERYLALAIGSMYERIIRGYFSQLNMHGKTKALSRGSLFKGVKECLEKLSVDQNFNNDLLKSWDVLVRIRNLYCHSFEFDSKKKIKMDELSDSINKHGFSSDIMCDSKSSILNVSRSFYEVCLDDFIVVVSKFEIMLGQTHVFESYIMDVDGYNNNELNNIVCLVKQPKG